MRILSLGPALRRVLHCGGCCLAAAVAVLLTGNNSPAAEPFQISGIYPHLAMFNSENECGTGAVVPWADRLWVVTYSPHSPRGSTDKLYEITPALQQIIRPESIGGTPANRLIHRESQQLFIGPYVIDAARNVRVIPYSTMFGRPTGTARHLTDPAGKVYCATMEEGLYEIDVRTLEVKELWTDEQKPPGRYANLPGYHGKGLYSGQSRVIYANNGEHGTAALRRPDVPSGALAEWDGQAAAWEIVRRNQFTEVSGPGGIFGNRNPATDPIWSIGWDHRSLILMLREEGRWHSYRLPKPSHAYDGAHGWNTEWPRIRDIGEPDLLMTMHGSFWRFPTNFGTRTSSGIAPRSTYLKVIGDFARWQDRIVFGCDDTAKAEFLNKRKAKGTIAAPQSQSNLWFVKPDELDQFGAAIGRGGLWVTEDVPAGTVTEAFLASGYDRRWLHLAHEGPEAGIAIELDRRGNGEWQEFRTVTLTNHEYRPIELSERAAWVRLRSNTPLKRATAWFDFSNRDERPQKPDRIFEGLAGPETQTTFAGQVLARANNKRTLALAAVSRTPGNSIDTGYYELDAQMRLRRLDDPAAKAFVQTNSAIPGGVLTIDEASVIFVDDDGKRWRLPKGDPAMESAQAAWPSRIDREVATERDLFNCAGTLYELPAENAGGFAKIRPVATHNRLIHDFCSYRGLFIMSGIAADAPSSNPHVIRSEDGRAALWVGVLDDVWKLGKARGSGGPWNNSVVEAGQPSDPFLMTGFDRKTLRLSHGNGVSTTITIELDLTGEGVWRTYKSFSVPAGKEVIYEFPDGFGAYWLRAVASAAGRATVQLKYD